MRAEQSTPLSGGLFSPGEVWNFVYTETRFDVLIGDYYAQPELP